MKKAIFLNPSLYKKRPSKTAQSSKQQYKAKLEQIAKVEGNSNLQMVLGYN